MSVDQANAPAQTDQALDPFGFRVGESSAIAGLGGSVKCPDPEYAFHTPYVPVGRGDARFTVRFRNLRGKRGVLMLRLHMLPDEPGAIARLINSERIQFNRLIEMDGTVEMPFESFSGVTYAVLGMVLDETDAAADGLEVSVTHMAPRRVGPQIDARSTAFGSATLTSAPHISTTAHPAFAEPVSQVFTPSQMAEPAFLAWHEHLNPKRETSEKAWENAYLLQVLDRYGMLQPGARGLGINAGADAPVAPMIARGATVVLTQPPGTAIPDEHWPSEVGRREVALPHLPADLVNFDFAWFVAPDEALDTVGMIEDFAWLSLEHVRPGGVMVYFLPFTPVVASVGGADRDVFTRADLERLALQVVSRGHDIARLKPGPAIWEAHDSALLTRFCLIVRRARTAY